MKNKNALEFCKNCVVEKVSGKRVYCPFCANKMIKRLNKFLNPGEIAIGAKMKEKEEKLK